MTKADETLNRLSERNLQQHKSDQKIYNMKQTRAELARELHVVNQEYKREYDHAMKVNKVLTN
eukprot:CAMPEP_0116940592 /NCGR_PEP_ID=MMETSP0467-20121206/33463_1 /TAXON_ID=283647 /ORGANISM="Mesodinium pulex, Strain SPMC105" /LENGTH=62 /DNA_ID=CAMNT_0004623171 /DNA_START=1253 /DNA_END=1441 /DNA_ORIENTATION=-